MWSILIGALSGIMLAWLILAAAILLAKPDDLTLGDIIRLLPDLLRLLKRMATDRAVPRMVRVELMLVLGYIFSPIQLIPDFVPVIGFLDDAVLVAIMLRIVVRTAGPELLLKHWPGTPQGLGALCRVCGVAQEG
ncbi:hypothetical protein AWB91_14535 [Mycobacterium paraense]|uniref:DUF1232 domain-containing protein n=1 Tax=Mycobacterium paraense TaxID=767916 RepID=A0A1X2ACT6_9MYCO|nr:DUF1232 domain-containing protein [Mycobacterium paraense]ORW31516.1 hypothetical protein AWB91_14535 [Mycobacterium paraense]ORW42704.1 hypothetical protein AWB88_08095 [Mycobacterium paraense]ORW48675.1 hypothetical protein AWB90_10530 [Mycobacterium paraense]